MKTFLSALSGAVVGGAMTCAVAYQILKKSQTPVAITAPKSRDIEAISPRLKQHIDRRENESAADYEPYRTPMEIGSELKEIVKELLDGALTEHEAKQIALRINSEIGLLALEAERTIKEFQPAPHYED